VTTAPGSLEYKITQSGGPLPMLRSAPFGQYQFPVLQPEVSTWGDEQLAWNESALLYDQSFHMFEVYVKGPDMARLLSDITANNVSNFGKNRGKQLIACNYDGQLIGDAILFGLEDDECVVVGTPFAPDWVGYQAQKGGYDVEVTRDDAIGFNKTGRRRLFRFQVQGPLALQIVEKASGGTMPTIKFFGIGEFTIAGHPVRALNHTMTGLPGVEKTGLEIYGAAEYGDEVKAALLTTGAEFGMNEGGALSYSSTAIPSGWLPLPLPAIYSGEQMRPYREYLTIETAEANTSLGGSFTSDNVEDYYVTPWDIGYGKVIRLDRDFIGADALRAAADRPHRQKVWLVWNDEDVADAWARSLFSDPPTKSMSLPTPVYSSFQYDTILQNDDTVGVSTWVAYTRTMGRFSSLAMIDEDKVRDGAEVEVMWGEPNGGSNRPHVERHVQIPIRATVSTTLPT
jgi:vanillate/3-O-methylgallate O-demethylase